MVAQNRIIAYTSIQHGNTRRVAEALAGALGATAVDASSVTAEVARQASLIGFGSGIFFGKHHQILLTCAAKCRYSNGTKSFIFSTAGFPYKLARIAGIDFHRELRQLLTGNGFEVVGEFSCPGYDTYGPFGIIGGIARGHPNAVDLERARAFALQLLDAA